MGSDDEYLDSRPYITRLVKHVQLNLVCGECGDSYSTAFVRQHEGRLVACCHCPHCGLAYQLESVVPLTVNFSSHSFKDAFLNDETIGECWKCDARAVTSLYLLQWPVDRTVSHRFQMLCASPTSCRPKRAGGVSNTGRTTDETVDLVGVVLLLLTIAGIEPEQTETSARGPKNYCFVARSGFFP